MGSDPSCLLVSLFSLPSTVVNFLLSFFSVLFSKSFPQIFRNHRVHSSTTAFLYFSPCFQEFYTHLSRVFLAISVNVPSSLLGISTWLLRNFILLSRKPSHCFPSISFPLVGIYMCFLGISSCFQEIPNALLEISLTVASNCVLFVGILFCFPGVSFCSLEISHSCLGTVLFFLRFLRCF